MKLAFNQMGSGDPIIILHGLFGSSDNWQTLGKKIAEKYSVYLIDQRNHGRSIHSDDFNYELLAEDINEFMTAEGLQSAVVVGHSMGGKTAMRFSQKYPEKVDKLVVADMGIKQYEPHHQKILEALHALDLETLESRKDADDQMAAYIPDFGTRQFILKNLYRKGKESFAWRINFPVLEDRMDEILAAIPEEKVQVPALFIRGEKSDYIPEADFDSIKALFPQATFVGLDVGHWVHAEDPEGFYKVLMDFIDSN